MSVLINFAFMLSLFFICESSFVDKIKKCSFKDTKCLMSSKQQMLEVDVGKNGIPELNVPPFDPMPVTNMSVTLLDGVTLVVTDGIIKGMSKCEYKNFTIDLEKFTCTQEINCKALYVKGEFVVSGTGEMVKQLVGADEIHGHGKAKGKLENMYMKYVFPFKPVKKDDGEIYMSVGTKGVQSKYNIEKATFATEKVFVNNIKQDLSDVATAVLNTSWKLMFNSAGAPAMKRVEEIYMSLENLYFGSLPTSKYIVEDLTPFVKN